MRIPPPIHWWLFGALTGIAVLSVARFGPIVVPLAVAVLFILAVRSTERAAVERRAEIDRSPSGGCSIYGVEEQAVAMGLYLAVGVGLTLYAAFRRRQDASAGQSAAAPRRR